MKSYTITVNGNVYDVTVEENTTGVVSAPAARKNPAPAASAPAPAAPASTGAAGSIEVKAGAAGKVVDVVAAAGSTVKSGDTIVVLEIMKMETPVVAATDGVIASVNVTKGETVASGAVLATMNN